MTPQDLHLIVPLIVVAGAALVVMLAVAVRRSHQVAMLTTMGGLAGAFVTLLRPIEGHVGMLLAVDDYTRVYSGLILAATAAVVLLSYDHLERGTEEREEYYILLLLAALGSLILVASVHFVPLFLGLELLSVSLYGLIAYQRTERAALEAGIKYLVLAATSAAFLLFGMALVYAETGTLAFAEMAARAGAPSTVTTLVGVGLIAVGFGFKLALVPFHLWTPDVYQGATAPVTAFVATVSKGAMFALLLRYAAAIQLPADGALAVAFAAIAVTSMAGGNLLALWQRNVKRLLAYSSIAHLGYLLVPFLAGGADAASAVTFYLAAYFITTLGAFGVVAVVSEAEGGAADIDEYRGLFARRPWLAGVFAAMLLSLAGIPLTAGFVAKFYVTVAGGSAALWGLLVVMMVTSGIGLFYYLRVIVAMFMQPVAVSERRPARARIPIEAGLTLAVLVVLLVWIGLYPGPLLALARAAVT